MSFSWYLYAAFKTQCRIYFSRWNILRGARMAQWWERSLPANVAGVRFPDPASYVGWVCCWFSTLLREVFSGYSGFPLSSKTNISKFQFDLDYCLALYHEPLARVIAKALPVFDIKFTFIYVLYTIGFTHFDRPSNLSCFRTIGEQVWFADKSLTIMLSCGWRQIKPHDNCIGLDEL